MFSACEINVAYLGLSTKTASGSRKGLSFCLASITWGPERGTTFHQNNQNKNHTEKFDSIQAESRGRSSEPDLVYVLAEGGNGGELADEVEVGGGQGVNGTAVERGQRLVGGQSQVLE